VNGFVESHSTPGARINQIGRWYEKMCPLVIGLRPPFNEFVAREVLDVARGVGVPVPPVGKKCDVNVEIIFSTEPQALLDHIAKSYRTELGFFPTTQSREMKTFSHPIQAWYETGTRQTNCPPEAASGMPVECSPLPWPQLDSDVTALGMQPSGGTGSRITKGLRSEFAHVLIIADGARVSRYSLQSIADYAAMLSLTRVAQLEYCAPLPSITDLLASGCATPQPDSLTAADRAYLKALYAADLEKNLNLVRGDLHEQMMRQIEGH
jgi:hypothetical protein